MMKLAILFPLLAILLVATGCGDFMGSDAPQTHKQLEDRKLAQGYTPCNDFPDPTRGVICSPNQYCGSQRLALCYNGCLSEDNCTDEQVCVKTNRRNVGTCTSKESLEDRPKAADMGPGYTDCGDPYSSLNARVCQPGTYCSSEYWADCSLGCLSELNCTELQTCVKEPGEHVGICTETPDDSGAASG